MIEWYYYPAVWLVSCWCKRRKNTKRFTRAHTHSLFMYRFQYSAQNTNSQSKPTKKYNWILIFLPQKYSLFINFLLCIYPVFSCVIVIWYIFNWRLTNSDCDVRSIQIGLALLVAVAHWVRYWLFGTVLLVVVASNENRMICAHISVHTNTSAKSDVQTFTSKRTHSHVRDTGHATHAIRCRSLSKRKKGGESERATEQSRTRSKSSKWKFLSPFALCSIQHYLLLLLWFKFLWRSFVVVLSTCVCVCVCKCKCCTKCFFLSVFVLFVPSFAFCSLFVVCCFLK